jgi:hypothetical protein
MAQKAAAQLPLEEPVVVQETPVETLPEVIQAQALTLAGPDPDIGTPIGMMVWALKNDKTEALRDLVQLRREMAADEARVAFARALVAFQADAPALPRVKAGLRTKGRDGGEGKVVSWYSPLDATYRKLRPYLAKQGLAVRCDLEPIDEGHIRVTHILTHELGHEAKSSMIAQREGTELANASQRMGGGVTIAKRVTLKAVLGLEEEDEGGHFDADAVKFLPAADVRALLEKLTAIGIKHESFLAFLGVDKPEHILDTPQMDARIRQLIADREAKLRKDLDAKAAKEGGAQ